MDLHDAIVTLPEGKILTLTATELALCGNWQRTAGHIVTYDALCAAVWGADYYGYENSLGVHIRHLREKLEPEPGAALSADGAGALAIKLTKGMHMKTFVRLIRRYVLAAVGIVLLLLFPVLQCWAGWAGWAGRRAAACRSGVFIKRDPEFWWRPPEGLPLGQDAPRRSG